MLRVAIDGSLPANRRIMVLEPVGTAGIVTATPDEARRLNIKHRDQIARDDLVAAMNAVDLELNGADNLFYYPAEAQAELRSEHVATAVRQLSHADAELFAAFTADAPADDLDEALVELDHWRVFGAFVDGHLACAASMYPWTGTELADLGVITLPRHRGHGLARLTIRAMSAHALGPGYEPQYRCQLDNAPSVALAASAGLERFATLDGIRDGTQASRARESQPPQAARPARERPTGGHRCWRHRTIRRPLALGRQRRAEIAGPGGGG